MNAPARLGPDEIAELLRTFHASGWSGMRLRVGDTVVSVGKDAPPPPDPVGQPHAAVPAPTGVASPATSGAEGVTGAAATGSSGPVGSGGAPTGPGGAGSTGSGAAPGATAAPPARAGRVADEVDPAGTVAVTAPTIGTFWAAPDPGSPPFVEVGSRVAAGDQLGIVEVMKLMNPVVSKVAGEVVAIRVANADLVEFEQPLFLVRPDE
ncbi:acetyl-CoA carboxylase biotin carboxyl carrier protein [Nocardia sp. NPDC057353]|uniref:acetyl-CoA carboxylase biotin carboxyl carrier protein n=1 Tax=Nocardia sp. NPDC057353 TaxID=3346104 RepID=UPI0036400E60